MCWTENCTAARVSDSAMFDVRDFDVIAAEMQ
jgi:hypothetical protein